VVGNYGDYPEVYPDLSVPLRALRWQPGGTASKIAAFHWLYAVMESADDGAPHHDEKFPAHFQYNQRRALPLILLRQATGDFMQTSG
jgi:hypothetical protein